MDPNYYSGHESPTYYHSSPNSSPRSNYSGVHYGSDFSSGSAHSSRTSHGVMYSDGSRLQFPAPGPAPRQRRSRRSSTVIIDTDDIPRLHKRGGSHSSFNSQGSRGHARAAEPDKIYVEENGRALIYDNRGRSRHRTSGSEPVIHIERPSRSASRRSRSRSRVHHAYLSSDDDSNLKRRSSMKKANSRSRRKSVSFSPETEVIDIQQGVDAIKIRNDEINSRPVVPDARDAVDPYIRPQVRAEVFTPRGLQEQRALEDRREEEATLDRLRRRQDPRPPVVDRSHKKKRRNSIIVTAPPMFHYGH